MQFELMFTHGLVQKQAMEEVLKSNDYTQHFGLVLSPSQATELVETRSLALRASGRIEFGGGVIHKLTKAFCDSPYLSMRNYAQTLHELVELFYHYKNEAMDFISDGELVQFMKTAYDGVCQGSLQLLSDRELYRLAKNLRFGLPADYDENSILEEEDDNYAD